MKEGSFIYSKRAAGGEREKWQVTRPCEVFFLFSLINKWSGRRRCNEESLYTYPASFSKNRD